MRVLLKVIGGKNDGREIVISIPRFIVGRGETAHLRPASDLVSREHAAIELNDGNVTISDLQSRNGTFVNGNKIAGKITLVAGDSVRIGRLQFEMIIDHVQAGAKKPRVINAVDAASRTATSTPKNSLEDSITDWLLEAGDEPASDSSEREAIGTADTVQFNLDDTTHMEQMTPAEASDEADPSSSEESKSTFVKKGKAKPMKLPPIEKPKHDNSTAAADDVLRKFFNRR